MALLQLMSITSALFMCWLFAEAGIHKLNPNNSSYYSTLIADYGWASPQLAGLIAKAVGFVEIIVALAIVYPATRGEAAIVAALILSGYLLHMAYQLYRGRRDLDCGCSGPGGQLKMSGHLLVRNLILVAVSLFCLQPVTNNLNLLWLLGGLFAIIFIIINLSSEQLIGNAQKLKALGN